MSLHEPPFGELLLKNGSLKIKFNGIYMSCPGRKEPILKNVSGAAEPGQLVAIMGPSGSGKTSMLNALSGRAKIDSGEITLNGRKLNKSHKRHMAYVLQDDLFLPNLTLRDTLTFHAELGMPSSMTHQQKMNRMMEYASIFKLDDPDLLKTKMGDVTNRGLSGGERKRANIACEMLSNPKILFVDEPTTGLDSHNACKVVENLLNVARNDRTVVMTIHQPSYKMFQMFDVVLLLCHGEVAYFGKREDVIPTLQDLNIEIEPHCNLADILLDQCFSEERRKAMIEYARLDMSPVDDKGSVDTTDNIDSIDDEPMMDDALKEVVVSNGNSHPKPVKLNVLLENGKTTNKLLKEQEGKKSGADSGRSSMFSDSSSPGLEDDKWPTSFATQVRILTKRNFKDGFWKFFGGLNWLNTLILSGVDGLLWFQTPRTEKEISTINAHMFFTCTVWLLSTAFETLSTFSGERATISKERASGMYRLSAYYCAKMIAELPLVMMLPMIFHTITRPMLGNVSLPTFFAHAGILMIAVLVSQGVGLFISTTVDNPCNLKKGIIALSLYSLPSILCGGFFVSPSSYWLVAAQQISPVYHTYRAMQIVEFHYGEPITCAAENSLFEVCRSGNATHIPPSDIIDAGEDLFGALLIPICVLIFFLITFRVLGYIILRFYKSPTRTV